MSVCEKKGGGRGVGTAVTSLAWEEGKGGRGAGNGQWLSCVLVAAVVCVRVSVCAGGG